MAPHGRGDPQDDERARDDDLGGVRPTRRGLIRGAVAAGIGAWTAPVILDSLASPAAAATGGCFQVFQTVGQGGFFTPPDGAWGAWSDGAGSGVGLPCGPGGCTPVVATTAAFRGTISTPTPSVAYNSATQVTLQVPNTCRIVGLGVSLQPGVFDDPSCATTTVNIASTSVSRFTCTGIGTSVVTVTPNGTSIFLNEANRGAWDTFSLGGDGRSSIVLQISCP